LNKRRSETTGPQFPARISPNRAIPLLIVLVALIAAYVVADLNDVVRDRNVARMLLVELEEEALHERLVGYEAVDGSKTDSEINGEIQDIRGDTTAVIEELERLEPGDEDLEQIRASLASFEAAVDEKLRLIQAGASRRPTP
jgi:hypothetical protein